MFEFIRTHQRLMQFLLLLVIAPAFLFVGVQGYSNIVGDPNAVAKVCGGHVSIMEYQRAQQEYMQTVQQQLGPNFRADAFNTPETRMVVLERLVSQRALACGALKRNIVASDDMLRQNILSTRAFQVDGKFSPELYKATLAASGLTPSGYEVLLRQQLAMQALSGAVLDSSTAPKTVVASVLRAQEEQREVQEFVVKPDAYTGQVKLADNAAKAYYDANQKEFQVPAQMRADYLVLSADALAANVTPDADEIKKFYEQNQAAYGTPEERQARHILIAAAANAPAAEIAAAKAKAAEVLAKLKADPSKFAQLAKEYSKDPGSAEKGGDLGFVTRGAFVKPFEDKMYSLKQGEISEPVQSEFGFHIIEVTAIKPSSVKPFEQVRGEIEANWKKQRAQKIYAESVDGFSDSVYSQSDSLKPAADKYKLKVQSAPLFGRANPPKELANPKLLDKLFADDAIKNKRNTDAVEIAPGVLVSARVVEYKPQTVQAFDDVKAAITTKLTQREAQTLASKEGEAKLKAAQANPDAVSFGAAKTVSRLKPEGIDPDAIKALMTAPSAKLPAVVGVELPGGGYAIYRINKVTQAEKANEGLSESVKALLARSQGESEFAAYLTALKQAAKIELHPENIEKK